MPLGAEILVEPDETVMEAAHRQGYYWPTVCGGRAECMACHLFIESGAEHALPPSPSEVTLTRGLVEKAKNPLPLRLACRLRVEGDMTVVKRAVRRRLTE
jgi:ferredoxin, 2Fe-2S